MLAIVGVAAAAVLALALPLALGAERLYHEDELLSLERDAAAAARGFDARAEPGDPVEFSPSSDQVAAYDRAGELIGGNGPARADALVREAFASGRVADSVDDEHLVVAVPILASERVVGAVRSSRSTAELSERILRMRLAIAGVAVLIIGLAAAAALALTRRLTRPILDLASAAAIIEAGERTSPSPRSGISELDTVADALDLTVERLNELVMRERRFSADASHQLRTPLAALRLELESRQLAGEDVDQPLAQVERLEATITTLLAAARDVGPEHQPFDIAPLLEEVRRNWTGPLAEQGRALEVSAPRSAGAVRAGAGSIREILGILLDNATAHGRGTVRVAARFGDGSLTVDVSDEGAGIERVEGIFERRSGQGLGIGLALARSLAEADGGRLDLISTGAEGTCFRLLLRASAGLGA